MRNLVWIRHRKSSLKSCLPALRDGVLAAACTCHSTCVSPCIRHAFALHSSASQLMFHIVRKILGQLSQQPGPRSHVRSAHAWPHSTGRAMGRVAGGGRCRFGLSGRSALAMATGPAAAPEGQRGDERPGGSRSISHQQCPVA